MSKVLISINVIKLLLRIPTPSGCPTRQLFVAIVRSSLCNSPVVLLVLSFLPLTGVFENPLEVKELICKKYIIKLSEISDYFYLLTLVIF